MKGYFAFFLLALVSALLLSGTVSAVYQREYTIEVQADGSAKWIIEHRFVKGEDEAEFRQLSDPTYFSDTFVKNVKSLVNAAKERTGRMNITVEDRSFVMISSVSGNYSLVKYQFYWSEFAETENSRVRIGDVFEVSGLFLYGDGRVNIIYPSNYLVEGVSPSPHADSNQTLTWYGVKDFGTGEPRITLRKKATFEPIDIIKENAFIIGGLITLVGAGSIGFYYFRLRKKEMKEIVRAGAPAPPSIAGIEDDEEKVVRMLRGAGGSLYQSTIADQCGFSRSKTSKLLATMESEGKIKREEKGREKVVMLVGEAKELEKTKRRDSN